MNAARISITLAILLSLVITNARAAAATDGYGVEVRQYPLGTIASILARRDLGAAFEGVLNLGTNIAYHGDQGEQDQEHGIGWGGGIGIRHQAYKELFGGVRLDLWRMVIDWKNSHRTDLPASGQSRFVVIQPTLEIGANFISSGRKFCWTPTASLGEEFNAFDHDTPTGHGLIFLLGLSVSSN